LDSALPTRPDYRAPGLGGQGQSPARITGARDRILQAGASFRLSERISFDFFVFFVAFC